MKVILFISFFIGFNSKSVGKSALAESIETQKQRMKGFIYAVADSQSRTKCENNLDNRSGDLI